MLIKYTRNNGVETHKMGDRKVSPEEGIFTILKYELGYGGKVAHLTEKNMHVVTPILSKTDHCYITFETKDELDMMVTMLKYWTKAVEETSTEEYLQKFSENLINITKGNALLIVHGENLL